MGSVCARWWEADCSTLTLIKSASRLAPRASRLAPRASRLAPRASRRGHDCAPGAGATPARHRRLTAVPPRRGGGSCLRSLPGPWGTSRPLPGALRASCASRRARRRRRSRCRWSATSHDEWRGDDPYTSRLTASLGGDDRRRRGDGDDREHRPSCRRRGWRACGRTVTDQVLDDGRGAPRGVARGGRTGAACGPVRWRSGTEVGERAKATGERGRRVTAPAAACGRGR